MGSRREDPRFGLFGASFALALVAHQLWWGGFAVGDLRFAVVLAALWLLVRPGSVARLAVLLGLEVASVASDLATIGDHTLLAAVTCACTLVALVTARGRPIWPALAPFLRAATVLLYGAAALAKLNAGFVDPAVSCAGPLSAQLAWWDPSLLESGWTTTAAIVVTIAVELALAVLLVVARTRRVGLLLGAAFHAALALAGNVPFAALALALYVAFLPAGARVPRPSRRARALLAGTAALLWLVGAEWAAHDPATARHVTHDLLRVATLAWAFGLAALVAWSRGASAPGRIACVRPVFAAGLALLALNAASPYLGLRTQATFTMFSNLQTEPGHWNHLLIPEAVRIFGAQDELVRLRDATAAPSLERRRRTGALMVRSQLERFLRQHPSASATYADAGDPRRRWTASAATLPERPLADSVLSFYDVRPGARGRC